MTEADASMLVEALEDFVRAVIQEAGPHGDVEDVMYLSGRRRALLDALIGPETDD